MSIIKRRSIQLEPAAPEGCAPGHAVVRPGVRPGARAAQGASARLLRADGVVRAIEVTCACGDVTVIELDYADPDAPQKPR